MATKTTETWDMIEAWKAEHPDLLSGGAPAPRPRLVPRPVVPAPPSADAARAEQREMIEQWKREHPELRIASVPTVVTPPARAVEPERRSFEMSDTPLTVLGAFIVGCIIGGIVMTIITGIAFWSFAGG